MIESLKNNETTEMSWDSYRDLSGQSATAQAAGTALYGRSGEQVCDVERRQRDIERVRKLSATNKLCILHTELRGLYSDIVPVGNDSKALRKLNCAERYVIRYAGEWEPFERTIASEIALHVPGVWMPTIARALAKMEKKMERHQDPPAVSSA